MLTLWLTISILTPAESAATEAVVKALLALLTLIGAYMAFELRQRQVLREMIRSELHPVNRKVDRLQDRQKIGFHNLGIEFDEDDDETTPDQ